VIVYYKSLTRTLHVIHLKSTMIIYYSLLCEQLGMGPRTEVTVLTWASWLGGSPIPLVNILRLVGERGTREFL